MSETFQDDFGNVKTLRPYHGDVKQAVSTVGGIRFSSEESADAFFRAHYKVENQQAEWEAAHKPAKVKTPRWLNAMTMDEFYDGRTIRDH